MDLHDEASVWAVTRVNGLLVMERAPGGGSRMGWVAALGCADDCEGRIWKKERGSLVLIPCGNEWERWVGKTGRVTRKDEKEKKYRKGYQFLQFPT